MNNEVSTLRQDIDSIHTDGIGKGSGAVKNVAYIGNCTMWRCGRRILEEYPELADGNLSVGGRGVERLSFNSLSKMLGRRDVTIKKWVDTFLMYGETKSLLR